MLTSVGSQKKQENSRPTFPSVLLTTLKPLTVWVTKTGKFKEMGIPDQLTCLLRNLYAGQEATIKARHGTMDWFQIGRGEIMETVTDFILFTSKITADGDCSHEIKRHLFLGRKAMTNLDSMLKSREKAEE